MPLDTLGVGAVCLSLRAPTSSWHDNDIVWRAWLKRSRTAGISMGLECSSGLVQTGVAIGPWRQLSEDFAICSVRCLAHGRGHGHGGRQRVVSLDCEVVLGSSGRIEGPLDSRQPRNFSTAWLAGLTGSPACFVSRLPHSYHLLCQGDSNVRTEHKASTAHTTERQAHRQQLESR